MTTKLILIDAQQEVPDKMNAEQTSPQDENSHPQSRPTQSADLTPIAVAKRIDVMDILRGFALIGIILMNIEWFNRSIYGLGEFDFSLSGIDWSAGWFIRLFVEGKFYKLFSLLFGMGFAVMLIRAQEAGRPFGAWFARRMFFLFLFGMAHMVFLWGGDILHDYAAGGLVLLAWVGLLRLKWKNLFNRFPWMNKVRLFNWMKGMKGFNNSRSFLRFGLGMLALPMVVSMGAGIYFGQTRTQDVMGEDYDERKAMIARVEEIKQDPILSASLLKEAKAEEAADELLSDEARDAKAEKAEADFDAMTFDERVAHRAEKRFVRKHEREEDKQKEITAFSQGTFWEATEYRAKESLEALKETPFFAIVICFPLFMVGYWFIASGALREPQNHLGLFKTMTWIGLGFGLFMATASLLMLTHPAAKHAIEFRGVSQMMFMLSQYLMTAGYLGAIVLATLTGLGQRMLSWLAPMGRMALTNYIMHSIILSTIFFDYAGGMYGEISRGPQVGIVAAIILMQALLSNWWLKHFQFGPLEWLWRSLTYLKAQPMRIENKAKGTPVAPIVAG